MFGFVGELIDFDNINHDVNDTLKPLWLQKDSLSEKERAIV